MKKLLLIVLLLAGCSAQANETLDVTLNASKSELEAFEPVTITATVMYNGEPLQDDVEIEFELINPNGNSIGSVKPDASGDGKYTIDTSFDGTGTYKVISHVSYGELHEMPEIEVKLK